MSNYASFAEPMATAAYNGSELTVDFIASGIGLKMNLSSHNAGMAVVGLTGLALGALATCMAVGKFKLKADDIWEEEHMDNLKREFTDNIRGYTDHGFNNLHEEIELEELKERLAAMKNASEEEQSNEESDEFLQ